ncbi:C45 family autoproteolytic acyltransferase/hydolase [Actinomadura chibensis]|uniref:Peptidase C45 hydrolase domain-containing protein n=1 Tax=Actinomadura chibensis TaxID=392828 RepID=A0A5D0NBJ6_9ACTN|nr:C45 family peptidase [Actinomadura chibensis]TYB41824.1 hypothetical protein FXF69_33355 [Actinomadura chibensis]
MATDSPAADPAPPRHRFRGGHRDLGRAHGEECRDLVVEHLARARARMAGLGVDPADAAGAAVEYAPHVRRHAPGLHEEITGVAEGAGIGLEDAYLLQLRAEVADLFERRRPASECSTFVATAGATAGDGSFIAQNIDLPNDYRGLGVVLELHAPGVPAVLQYTPAGQVSYVGINDRGLGVFANFLSCDGWRRGFPRYLLSRAALGQRDVPAATALLRTIPRASSRNLIMLDSARRAVSFENTVERDACLEPDGGILAHTNHYIADALTDAEAATPDDLENSRTRLKRLRELLDRDRGRLDLDRLIAVARDRSLPHALSRLPGERPDPHLSTVASVIAEPSAGRMHIAPGPPSHSAYRTYAFAK